MYSNDFSKKPRRKKGKEDFQKGVLNRFHLKKNAKCFWEKFNFSFFYLGVFQNWFAQKKGDFSLFPAEKRAKGFFSPFLFLKGGFINRFSLPQKRVPFLVHQKKLKLARFEQKKPIFIPPFFGGPKKEGEKFAVGPWESPPRFSLGLG